MPVPFIIIASILLTIMALVFHFHGMDSDEGQITVIVGAILIVFAGILPVYNFENNTSILDIPVYETELGYVAMHDETMHTITDHYTVNTTIVEDIKMVDRKRKCGFGLYTASNIHMVNVTDPKWKKLLTKTP